MTTRQINAFYVGALLVALAAVSGYYLWPQAAAEATSFGQCLTDKGVAMYGVDTCPNCERQKEILGEDFADTTYVNCYFSEAECREKGVQFYPMWQRGTESLIGVQSRDELSEFSGCEV